MTVPYLQITDDEIMFVAPGVCPLLGVRTHVCKGQFSLTGFVRTFKLVDVCKKPDGRRVGDRNCRFCDETLVPVSSRRTPTGDGGTRD